MRIISGGSIGIGTSSPASYTLLDVNGQAIFRGNPIIKSGNALKFNNYYNSGTGTDRAVETGYAGQIYFDTGSGYISFQNSSSSSSTDTNISTTERMRITSSGDVCFAKTSTAFGTVGHALLPNGQVSHVADGITPFFLNRLNADGDIAYFYRSSNLVGSISVTTTSTSYNTSSDYRLKEDLKDVNGLEKVSAIKVYDYKWKSCNERMDGVLAHELAEVLPYAVNGEKDGEQMQGVDYSKIVPILIKSIQELEARIKQLENK